MAGEVKTALFAIHSKDSDVVSSLVAAIEKLPLGIEAEAARVVPTCPFFTDMGQGTSFTDRKNPDAVVQAIASINKPAIV